MIGISFFRVMKAAGNNFFRNVWLSIATTVIMTITLLIVMFLYFANIFGLEVIENIQQKIDLSATFTTEASDEAMSRVVRNVEQRPDVRAVQFVSSDEALQIFRERNIDNPYIEESLAELEKNPLPASLFIVADDPEYYEDIARYLGDDQFGGIVEKVNFEDSRDVIQRLISIITTVKNAGFIITIVFAALVILIMFNTVRLAIYSFREEIDIMHLVGASRWYIRGPFMLESVLVAILAVIISTAIIYPLLNALAPELQRYFLEGYAQQEPFNVYAYAIQEWPTVVGLQLAVALGLAIISSLIAIQRYLKA